MTDRTGGGVNVLWIAVGLPRSGKSTWARATGCPVVCGDAIRLALHGEAFIPGAERFVWAAAHLMVEALFLAGHTEVVLDTCATTRERRAEWKDKRWIRRYQVFEANQDLCRKRAMQDSRADLLPVIDRMALTREPIAADEQDEL